MDVVTIVGSNYLAYAEVLLASVRDHHPDAGCSLVVVDVDDRAAIPSEHDVMTLADLGFDMDEVHRRRGMYDVLELATSVKPAALAELLARGATTAVYLDPDIVLYRPLVELEGLATTHQIVLTPHVLAPLPMDRRYVADFTIHFAGVFNLGFAAVSPDAGPFLEFWDHRLRRMCRVDPTSGVFVDQRWVDQVPALFPHTVVRDRGWNVAYWNLHERPLTRTADGTVLAGDQPLRFFHFSGHDPLDGALLSRHQGPFPTVLLSEHPVVADLCHDWRDRVLRMGHRPLGEAGNGLELTPLLRRLFNEACLRCEEAGIPPPPSPATPGGRPAFVDWCHGPSPWTSVGEVPALLHALWFLRPDIQAVFPSPSGVDRAAFSAWTRDDPHIRAQLPHDVLPDGRVFTGEAEEHPLPGLNVVGYFESVLGIGEAGRRVVLAAEAAGLPVATSVDRRTSSAQSHVFRHRDRRLLPFDTTVFAVNADRIAAALASHGGPSARSSRRTVGFWFWEVDRLAAGMESAFGLVDEIWVASSYVAAIFRAHTELPVRCFPFPVLWPATPTNIDRADLGLDEGRFLFLFVFDFFSVLARKNPLGLIEAYRRAFGPDDGAGLVLKSVNGTHSLVELAQLERLRMAAVDRPDIEVRDGYLAQHETRALIELTDAYASLHRAEGFGLTMADAMAAGKPVIATGYSGNLDFMDPATAHLVPYELTVVGSGAEPYPADAVWAQPDLDAAADLMRAVFDDRTAAAELGSAARTHVRERNSIHPAAQFLATEILPRD